MPDITFLIPSLGRPSLATALASLHRQTNPSWCALVCFDRVPPTTQPEEKVAVASYLSPLPPEPWRAGAVRNHALQLIKTPWTALLDDDDTVTPDYVDVLLRSQNADLVIFQMRYQDGRILPRNEKESRWRGRVGISFAFRTTLGERVKFQDRKCEDFYFLESVRALGLRVRFVPQVTYLVKH